MIGVPAIYAAQALASGLGAAYAWRVRGHRPVALLIAFGLGLDLALEFLPDGAFVARMMVGSAYPWAVLAVTALTLRGDGSGRLGSKGGRRWVALVPLGFACYLAALLSSGVRGPALAWCYAGAQAGLAVAMAWVVWEWRRGLSNAEKDGAGDHLASFRDRARALVVAATNAAKRPTLGATCAATGEPMSDRTTEGASADPCDTIDPRVAADRNVLAAHSPILARRPPTATEIAAIICASAEIANVPAYLGLPGWIGARSVYALAYIALIFVQSRALLGGIPACRISTPST